MPRQSVQTIQTAAPDAELAALLALPFACQRELGGVLEGALPQDAFLLAAAGRGGFTLSWEGGGQTVAAGQLAVLCAAGGYALRAEGDCLCALVQVQGDLAARLLAPKDGCELYAQGAAAVRESVLALAVLDREHGEIDAETASAQAYTLLMKLRRARRAGVPAAYSPLVEAAIGIIEEEFAYLEGLDTLAERLEISKPHLIRTFTREVGVSPGKYITRTRIEYAKLLLSEPDMTIGYAADATGFASANYFAKVFRRETGLSPTEYQQTAPRVSSRQLREEDRLNIL